MNIFYFLLLLATHIFIQTDDSPNFTFKVTDEKNVLGDSAIIQSCVIQYEDQTQTVEPKDSSGNSITFKAGSINLTFSKTLSSTGKNYNLTGIRSIIFKLSGTSPTTNTITFGDILKNNGSFTLKKDDNSYSATDITNPSSDEKNPEDKKGGDQKSEDQQKSDDKKSDADQTSQADKLISQVLTTLTINNQSGQDIIIQEITFDTSYTEDNQQKKPDPSISKSFKKQNTVGNNNKITVRVNLKHKFLLSYTGISSIKVNDSTIKIQPDDIGKVAREINIIKKDNTITYEVPQKPTTSSSTDKAAEKKDDTLPNPTKASTTKKNDTSSKDAFVQSLHDSGH